MENQSQEEQSNKTIEKPWLFQKGNPGGPGRPTGKSLKEYQAEQFRLMTDEQKKEWLEDNKVNPEIRWRMAEGNPATNEDLSGEVISKVVKLDE